MENQTFSIIVPVYNVEQYLENCINSVLNQSYRNFQLILVDDGSKDSSGEICDRFAQKIVVSRLCINRTQELVVQEILV